MKKTTLLNAPISAVVAKMGHTDTICIGDAGLPIPKDVERIDLAVTKGIPAFMDVFKAVVSELVVEKVTIALEMQKESPKHRKQLLDAVKELEKNQGLTIEIVDVSHEMFKQQTHACRAVIRTGEATPYMNVILQSGVKFN